jgi:hypothetical protein
MQTVDRKLTPTELLRIVKWPFCVAGCLAEPEQQTWFRHNANDLQPSGLYVTVCKPLEIIEATWLRREAHRQGPLAITDMASCFAATREIIFLI